MSLSLLNSFFRRSQVSYLIFYVTGRCNFRCNFCFYHAEIEKADKAKELSVDEIGKFSKTIGPLIQLSLTGGEPFLRDDLPRIAELFIRNTKARYITIPTNASLTAKMVDFINEVLPKNPCSYFRIAFSIDGIGDSHDQSRGHKGAWGKIVESYNAVSPLREKYDNLVLDANAIFNKNTENTILSTLETLHEDFKFDNLSVTYARGDIKDASLKDSSFEKYVEMNNYLETIDRVKEKRPLYFIWRGVRDLSREYLIRTISKGDFVTPCVAGRKLLVVNESGNVFPCEILDKSMGNLRDFDYDLNKMLARNENKAILLWIEKSKCECSFECALAANVLWGESSYSRLLKAALRNI